jgi:hypothetical protein
MHDPELTMSQARSDLHQVKSRPSPGDPDDDGQSRALAVHRDDLPANENGLQILLEHLHELFQSPDG